MAFFGLTALGPQNPFSNATTDSAKARPLLHVFDDRDFENAWKRTIGYEITTCEKGRLFDIFYSLFRGPVPEIDSHFLENAFHDEPEEVDIRSYMAALRGLRDYLEQEKIESLRKPGSGRETTSVELLKERNRRHIRYFKNPNEKLSHPLTTSQEYGWLPQVLEPPVAGKKDSPVTKFQDELIRNGVYY